jgi:hypothetical protein
VAEDMYFINDSQSGQVYQIVLIPYLVDAEMCSKVPSHLVYIEWFTSFLAQPDWVTGPYKVSKCSLHDRTHLSSVVPLSHIHRSIHLFPKFGPLAPSSWSNSTVLDQCAVFYLNPFSDQNLYAELCL